MSHKIRIGTEELDSDELNRRIPGLALNIPCSAKGAGGEDGASAPSCENYAVLEDFPWYGSSTRVVAAARSKGAAATRGFSFTSSWCSTAAFESLQLDDVLMEGGGLDECRDLVLSALRQNTSLQTLTICNLYEHK
ncbi:hypothetical protein MTO96_017716 [Rhipicephalus appendiculatus]